MTSLYTKKSALTLWKNRFKSMFIQNSLERLSAKNELNDYSIMLKSDDQKLWELHSRLEKIRQEVKSNYDSYDYGNGYFYQSFSAINISGYRDTEARVDELKLKERLKGKSVLDIGSNAGFILLSIADQISSGVGIEFNQYLVQTGKEVQAHLGHKNIEQIHGSFENYSPKDQMFDSVLSLANHSTYDGNTEQSIDDYFQRISSVMNENGILIFESHPPEIEPEDKLQNTLKVLSNYFDITEKPTVNLDRFLDKNRTYVIATKK